MKSEAARLAAFGIPMFVVLATGVLLTRSGGPYSTALLTLHKLVDLGIVLAIGVVAYRLQRTSPLSAGVWSLLIATAVLVVATFASGGVSSAMAEPPKWVLGAHRVGSWLAAAGMLASAWVVTVG